MRILVVEDSPAVQNFHRFAMRVFKDVELVQAYDGLDALEQLTKNRFDVVLLDINLPLMNGLDVLSKARREAGDLAVAPVIVVTGDVDGEMAKRAEDMEVFKILHKPVAAHVVRDAVSEALDRPAEALPKGAELRRSPRLRIEVTAVIPGEAPLKLSTLDISPYGAFLVSDDPLPLGTKARLVMELPHLKEPLEVGFRVAHTRDTAAGGMPAGFGVSFDHDSPELSDRLVQAFLTPPK